MSRKKGECHGMVQRDTTTFPYKMKRFVIKSYQKQPSAAMKGTT
jgi:hypothetical protein